MPRSLKYQSNGIHFPNPSAPDDSPETLNLLPHIVVVINEFADLVLQFGKKIELLICWLTRKARDAGIHLIIATERPDDDVLSPVIQASFSTRISFWVPASYLSAIILGERGPSNFVPRGDMLLKRSEEPLVRVHGAQVTDSEIARVTDYLRTQGEPEYLYGVHNNIEEERISLLSILDSLLPGEKHEQAFEILQQKIKEFIDGLKRRLTKN